jgi:hypothetical protein
MRAHETRVPPLEPDSRVRNTVDGFATRLRLPRCWAVRSTLTVHKRPSTLKHTEVTTPEWPARVRRQRPLSSSHSPTVSYQLPVSAWRPSALSHTDVTTLVWPVTVLDDVMSLMPMRVEWAASFRQARNVSGDRSCPGVALACVSRAWAAAKSSSAMARSASASSVEACVSRWASSACERGRHTYRAATYARGAPRSHSRTVSSRPPVRA